MWLRIECIPITLLCCLIIIMLATRVKGVIWFNQGATAERLLVSSVQSLLVLTGKEL